MKKGVFIDEGYTESTFMLVRSSDGIMLPFFFLGPVMRLMWMRLWHDTLPTPESATPKF